MGGGGLGGWGKGIGEKQTDLFFVFRVKGVNISPTSTSSKYILCLYALQRSHLVITNHTTKHMLICSAAELKYAVMENLDSYWSP